MKWIVKLFRRLYKELSNFISISLWWILPRRLEVVRGVQIKYIKLPTFVYFWLTGSLSKGHVCVVRRLFNLFKIKRLVPIIFVTGRDPYLRYTVYHEYCEGKVFTSAEKPENTFESFLDDAKYLVAMYYSDGPFVVIDDNDQSTVAALRMLYVILNKQIVHYSALAKEIKLAHEEMSEEAFALYCKVFRSEKRF